MKAHSPPPCLTSWVMESETPLQCATKELEYVQQHLNKLSCIFDQLENTTVDSDVSSEVILRIFLFFFFFLEGGWFILRNILLLIHNRQCWYFYFCKFFLEIVFCRKNTVINWCNFRCRKQTVCLQVWNEIRRYLDCEKRNTLITVWVGVAIRVAQAI